MQRTFECSTCVINDERTFERSAYVINDAEDFKCSTCVIKDAQGRSSALRVANPLTKVSQFVALNLKLNLNLIDNSRISLNPLQDKTTQPFHEYIFKYFYIRACGVGRACACCSYHGLCYLIVTHLQFLINAMPGLATLTKLLLRW